MPGAIGDIFSWSLLGIPAFLFVITVVVFFHELGHFSVARFFGVAIKVFSVGFGRELFGWNDRQGTRWRVSALPLGGYVKFAGDADASSRPDQDEMENMDPAERAAALHFKPLYQRALVVAAGPVANFILGIVIFAGLFFFLGMPVSSDAPIVGRVAENSAAAEAGLAEGDLIRSVDGVPVATFLGLQQTVTESQGRALNLEVEREGEIFAIVATPRATEETGLTGATTTVYRLGFTNTVSREPVGPFAALAAGTSQTWFIVTTTMGYLGQIVTGQASPDQLAGPLGIAKVTGDVAAQGFVDLLGLAALVSVSIGLINLFPIPVLDGGHLLYYAFEAVRGRPLGERAQELGFRLGLAVVLSLMLLATFNDLVRFNLF